MKIRLLQVEDLPTRVSWMNHKNIYLHMHYDIPINYDKTLEWFDKTKTAKDRIDLAVEENGVLVSMCGLTGLTQKTKVAESYIFVDPNVKSKGVGSRSLFLQCAFAFKIWQINKVSAVIDTHNVASIALYKKIGFLQEGTLRQEGFRDDMVFDRIYKGCLIDDFKEKLFQYEVNVEKQEIEIL